MSSEIVNRNGIPFILSSHPRGSLGSKRSLDKVVEFIARDRLDPRTRAWTIQKLAEAGNPKSDYEKAKTIYDILKKEKIYVPDPFDAEFMQSAICTLDNCGGVAFHGGDCDDLAITYGSTLESIGIRAAVIGHSYREDKEIGHVIIGFWDEDAAKWIPVDLTIDLPFGETHRYTREIWLDIPSAKVICDSDVCDRNILPPDVSDIRTKGDFVGFVPENQLSASSCETKIDSKTYISTRTLKIFSIYAILSGFVTAYILTRDRG
jgi:transglutaminase-like putative cysteine protease